MILPFSREYPYLFVKMWVKSADRAGRKKARVPPAPGEGAAEGVATIQDKMVDTVPSLSANTSCAFSVSSPHH
jgi:hypothetical protein